METNKNIEPRIDIDDYLEKPYWVVDILPRQVPPNANGQFFRIEDYLSIACKRKACFMCGWHHRGR